MLVLRCLLWNLVNLLYLSFELRRRPEIDQSPSRIVPTGRSIIILE